MVATTPTAEKPAGTDLASGLLEVIGPIRRVLRRAVRQGLPEGTISPAQVELLTAVDRQPGLRVHEIAASLALAPNSVSTLVNQVTAAGLLHRDRDPGDRRGVRLRLTERGEAALATRRQFRRAALRRALEDLEGGDRDRIEAALPALRRLATALEEQS